MSPELACRTKESVTIAVFKVVIFCNEIRCAMLRGIDDRIIETPRSIWNPRWRCSILSFSLAQLQAFTFAMELNIQLVRSQLSPLAPYSFSLPVKSNDLQRTNASFQYFFLLTPCWVWLCTIFGTAYGLLAAYLFDIIYIFNRPASIRCGSSENLGYLPV